MTWIKAGKLQLNEKSNNRGRTDASVQHWTVSINHTKSRKLPEKQKQHAYTPQNKLLTRYRRRQDSELTSGDTGRIKPQYKHQAHGSITTLSVRFFYLPVQEGITTLTAPTRNIFIYRYISKTSLFSFRYFSVNLDSILPTQERSLSTILHGKYILEICILNFNGLGSYFIFISLPTAQLNAVALTIFIL